MTMRRILRRDTALARLDWRKLGHAKAIHHAERWIHLVYYGGIALGFEHVHFIACVALVLVMIPLATDGDA